MSGVFSLFNIFSFIYLFRGLQLLNQLRREWTSLKTGPLTAHKKYLGDQASFFVAVPIGVFLHEGGHALAVWLFGGQVAEFGYRVFWGYVQPLGTFTAVQDWFISLAGTLGNLIFGLTLWLLLRRHASSSYRYFALRAFRFQLHFALIYYPIFTLFLPIGDWKTIYNFGATPIASGIMAVFHATLLLLFWQVDRIGWFERPAFATTAAKDQYEALQQHLVLNPQDTNAQLQRIDILRQGRANNKAKYLLNQLIKQEPNAPRAYLQRAALKSQRGIPRTAADDVNKALQLGLSDPISLVFAHQLLGEYAMEHNDAQTAVTHYSQAIANAKTIENNARPARLYYQRSRAYRRAKQFDLAFQNIQQAIKLAEQANDQAATTHYRDELKIIENHAGRSFTTGSY
ncbi:MAG: M50 family metallopeptidase [Anaerolineales bacterium]|nr:M50 family metallopeptidase [Anaerolineales bacterium]